MARMYPQTHHSNLGDEPGKTHHGAHTGMHQSAHGHRARGGRSDPEGRDPENGGTPQYGRGGYRRGGGLPPTGRSRPTSDDGGDDEDYTRAMGGSAPHPRYQRGGRGGSRGDRLMSGRTDSALSDTGARDKRTDSYQYNAKGSPTMKTATDEVPGFQRGGRKRGHRKAGGATGGATAMPRLDHFRRGGSTRTPYSSGSSLSPPSNDREGRGYEGGGQA